MGMGSQFYRAATPGGMRSVYAEDMLVRRYDSSPEVVTPIRYVALGDSNTTTNQASRIYPALINTNSSLGFYRLSGEGNLDTDELVDELAAKLTNHTPNVVTCMMGTNDHKVPFGDSVARVSLAQFEANYRTVIEACGDARVILLTPPYIKDVEPSAASSGYSRDRLQSYCKVVHGLAKEYALPLVDVYLLCTLLCEDDETTWVSDCTVGDGVHLNNVAHQAIFDLVWPLVLGTA